MAHSIDDMNREFLRAPNTGKRAADAVSFVASVVVVVVSWPFRGGEGTL